MPLPLYVFTYAVESDSMSSFARLLSLSDSRFGVKCAGPIEQTKPEWEKKETFLTDSAAVKYYII